YGPAETIEMFKTFQRNAQSEQARNNQFLIIGPGTHCDYTESTDDAIVGARNLGDASLNYSALQLQWYDYWLKGKENAITEMPHIQYYVMGKNQWRNSEVWPLASTNYQKWYLAGKGKAQSRTGDGLLSLNLPENDTRDSYVYDPADPVPSLGGHTCCTGSDTEAGGYDQSEIELRQDVLVYTSPELIHGFEVTGELKAVLYVSSSAVDTDFTVKLVDVYPTGKAYNIQEGAIRMRYRNSLSDSQLIEPGKIYQVEVALNVTSNYFAAGHKLRVEISSSNFPRWERNLNTGGNNYDETNWKTAQNTIYHSAIYPSHLVLPVIIESP
ncbi:MAG: CocE/NonD family hydrolase, partial [Pseudomonadota bacterium]|nr:CocE/NonD family hydrolase [Pseudomonadota bacterium]